MKTTIKEYDPLDKELDFSKLKRVDKKFVLSNQEKINLFFDFIISDYHIDEDDFKNCALNYFEKH